MILIFILVFLAPFLAAEGHSKTLHGAPEPAKDRIYSFYADDAVLDVAGGEGSRVRRSSPDSGVSEDLVTTKISHLNDTHKQLMVHWVGNGSKVVICLARDPAIPIFDIKLLNPSSVFISYDDGDSYQDKTDQFKLANGSLSILEKFYTHPTYDTHFVFTDIIHNTLYVTKNHGRDFKRIELKFTPSELSFHDLFPDIFVVLDKNDTQGRLWITEDFGQTFRQAHEFVKAFHWVLDDHHHRLLVHRNEPNGLGSIIYSNSLFRNRVSEVYATNIKDFYKKGDYLFTTKNNSKGHLQLFVSNKLSKQQPCYFDTTLEITNFYIVDVSKGRAMVAASHTPTKSNLYVSNDLEGKSGGVLFTLSLEEVFAFFPNTTWIGTLLHHISEESFADVYKVEGVTGIYVASKVITKPINNNLGPQHLASVISFDHGASWRPIQPPSVDMENQDTSCVVSKGCSLHLGQKFSQIYPESRSVPVMSSKSAPGTIIATGVLGSNLKGHQGVYVSVDAGLTWRQTLRDLYFFNMGDHGGILSAVKYYKTKGETRHILYSVDEGETWNQTQFHNEEIRLYGLMTEPGENTTVFTMFGSLSKEHRWLIVTVDFSRVFPRNCNENDYKMWTPGQNDENRSYIPCILGEQVTYQKRLRNANCLNGLDYTRVVSKRPCDCDVLDFECDFGFKSVGTAVPRCVKDNSKSWLVYDPYKVPDDCPPGQFYLRTKGYRKIPGDDCVQGFESHFLPDSVPCPIEEFDDFLLFAQRENISRYNLVSGVLEPLPVKNLKNVIAIDFDMEKNCVYWADINLDTINRQCFKSGSQSAETLVSSDLASIEGLALDWVSKTLYFVDGARSKIELIKTDVNHSGRMRKVILDKNTLKKPRGIAVHPQAGYFFWTDWSSEAPSVNRANLDGTHVKILFNREKVEWPNGITVDYIANRIYWVDARKDYIGSSDLHGDGFVNVVHSSNVVSHPFAVAVFKSNLYWDDWKKNAIYSSDKDQFTGFEVVVKDLVGLMDLKVFAHGLQIGTNACVNATCTHICVGMPKSNFTCLCPDGMELGRDNKTCLCPGGRPPLVNGTCAAVGNTCNPDFFTCSNKLCVPKTWTCDGEDDCGDNSDESSCGLVTCPSTFHQCGDGKCLPSYWKCDYDKDCADGSDEIDCPRPNCTDSQFQCTNGRCISKNWKCDGENDCRDNSDELDCTKDVPTQCKADDEFQCKSGAVTCIPSTWKCDGEPDCRDGSDESLCKENVCSESQFACGPPTNRCIYFTWVCDGDIDCADGRDEANCTNTKPDNPKVPFFPKNQTCQDWMFRCKNDRCIPSWWKCDNVSDCGDNSDELDCPMSPPTVPSIIPTTRRPNLCANNQFRCHTGQCILSSWVCDGSHDCPNGEDEHNCDGPACRTSQFKCVNDGSCIFRSKVCDGAFDCPDGTDEAYCHEQYLPNEPATPSCSIGFFPCDGGSCFPLSAMCDGRDDCLDGYDEKDCSKKQRVYQVMQMGIDIRNTNYTSLLLYWAFSPLKPNLTLEFLPSISKAEEGIWQNKTWTQQTRYLFTDLVPYTKYNMTVFVREKGKSVVFPPARYHIASTPEGVPSAPLNVKVKQQNGSHILVSWDKPLSPNGVIRTYQISWSPTDLSVVRLKLNGNETSHLLSADFQHNRVYTFRVSAFNGLYESGESEPAQLTFDGKTVVHPVEDLQVSAITNATVLLTWSYKYDADGFAVNVTTRMPDYPALPSLTTKSRNVSVPLAPGTPYDIQIYAYHNGLDGPRSRVEATTLGSPLPVIDNTQAILSKDGTTVKLSWNRPEKYGKVTWIYGVYYRSASDGPTSFRQQIATNATSASVANLRPCETYLFAVGLVGPYGIGPLSTRRAPNAIKTTSDPRAPPKNLRVQPQTDPADPLKMVIKWEPNCAPADKVSYIISITEKVTKRNWRIKVSNKLAHTVTVENGGVYAIVVSTTVRDAKESEPVVYEAPIIYPPTEFHIVPEANGSYFLYWNEPEVKPDGPFYYEVLVHAGREMNETTAQIIKIDRPPFVYTVNASAGIYTFSVRIRSKKGFVSPKSESLSSALEGLEAPRTNLPAIIVPSVLLVVVCLVAVIVTLVLRNRRLHNNFVRFANSHYNTRSDAATFDENGLDEEEENPRIVGFSDDEPLVVA